MKVKLREINVGALNTPTVILLAQFVRLAKAQEGANLRMQQADIVRQIFQFAASSQNPDLIVLFMHIKKSLAKHIKKSNLENPSFNMYSETVY